MNVTLNDAVEFMVARWKCVKFALQKVEAGDVPEDTPLRAAFTAKNPILHNKGAYCIPPHFVFQSFEFRQLRGKTDQFTKAAALKPLFYLPWDCTNAEHPKVPVSTARGSAFMTAYWERIKEVRTQLTTARKALGGPNIVVGSAFEWEKVADSHKNLLE
jgi:hypothetical protein